MTRPPKKSEAKTPPKPKRDFDDRFPVRDSDAVKVLTESLKRIRKERRLNQAEFAELIGLDQPAVSLLENGRANLTIVQTERIARALGLEFIDLFRPE